MPEKYIRFIGTFLALFFILYTLPANLIIKSSSAHHCPCEGETFCCCNGEPPKSSCCGTIDEKSVSGGPNPRLQFKALDCGESARFSILPDSFKLFLIQGKILLFINPTPATLAYRHYLSFVNHSPDPPERPPR